MDHENVLRWTAEGRSGHVESHFLKANSRDGQRALWIKHTVFVPAGQSRGAVAEVWAIAFDRAREGVFPVGGKVSVPIDQAQFDETPFAIHTAGAELRSGRAQGSLEQGEHHLRWDLRYEPLAPPFRPFPSELMYRARFPKSKTLTPCPDGEFTGELVVDDETWAIDAWPGMQGHNWGRGHADAYAWAHCNAWDGEQRGVWFEGLSGKVAVGPMTTPWLSVAALHIDGRTHRFDGLSSMLSRHVQVDFDRWQFRFAQGGCVLEGDVRADRAAMAGLLYRNPHGPPTYCLNSKLARATLVLQRPDLPSVTLETDKIALEIGTHDPHHGVRMVA